MVMPNLEPCSREYLPMQLCTGLDNMHDQAPESLDQVLASQTLVCGDIARASSGTQHTEYNDSNTEYSDSTDKHWGQVAW